MNFPSLFVEFVLECTIRATLLVAVTALLLRMLRVRHADTKHRVWTGVLLLMLVLPGWTAWGPKVSIRVLPQVSPSSAGDFALQPALPVTAPQLQRAAPGEPLPLPFMPLGEQILVCTYLAGFWGLLMRLAMGTRAANRVVRRAVEQNGHRGSGACAAPMTVGWLRPVVILPENWREWPREQLSAVLAHENEHVRRRDPLVRWIGLFNRAVWWFHPAAWWLESELSKLAEESCDAAVLTGGHDASQYAETLIEMTRAVTRAGARVKLVGMAMPGGHLTKRIQQIIGGVSSQRISRTRMALLAATCTITCAAFAAGTLERQSVPQSQTARPEFEVASVKVNNISDTNESIHIGPGRFTAVGLPLKRLIEHAYKVRDFQVSGGPGWINSKRYDIEAKTDTASGADPMFLMLQKLLEDRFGLRFHHDTKEGPVYFLTISRDGIKMRESTCVPFDPNHLHAAVPDQKPSNQCDGITRNDNGLSRTLDADGLSMADSTGPANQSLAGQLSLSLGRPVIDKTGLTGLFDVHLQWTEPTAVGPRGSASDSNIPPSTTAAPGPSVFTALQEQLGLKLESGRGPVNVLVIDHVEEPSMN